VVEIVVATEGVQISDGSTQAVPRPRGPTVPSSPGRSGTCVIWLRCSLDSAPTPPPKSSSRHLLKNRPHLEELIRVEHQERDVFCGEVAVDDLTEANESVAIALSEP
jgi:hypothetical protein